MKEKIVVFSLLLNHIFLGEWKSSVLDCHNLNETTKKLSEVFAREMGTKNKRTCCNNYFIRTEAPQKKLT